MAESVAPDVAAAANVNVAPTALLITPRPIPAATLVNVVAVVLFWLFTLVTPVAPNNDNVAPVVSKKLITSIPETFATATVEAACCPEMFNVSVPSPPTKVSVVLNVAPAAVAAGLPALNVSLPDPPVNAEPESIPVVSDQVQPKKIFIYINDVSCDTHDILHDTYSLPT